jgi:hypothetical protein
VPAPPQQIIKLRPASIIYSDHLAVDHGIVEAMHIWRDAGDFRRL